MVGKRLGAIVGALVLLVAGAAAAYAFWVASGTGSGTAKTISAVNLTVVADTGQNPDLYPGASGAIYFTIHNPNPYPINLTNATLGTPHNQDGASACQATTSGITNLTVTGGTIPITIAVPARAGTGGTNPAAVSSSLAGAIQMTMGADPSCQSQTFIIPVSLTGTSS